ncbi:ubiquitin-like-specific protease ESD4 [Amborella trichopoda]|uniref:Ubiquitin-like protease family profile domain-containing protein n=1 Tax=Amborella trichopoda TaxID=13333 RepID=W1P3M3_AMBTC|nr:ubiquitin-like-specific protease ESD4 [Amborella trichopoda]XP_020520465.1 ubiquitin-like-specific protease ESD4 [Amborella trichopoda]XP_020520466.1 ubiquitin-like-specific protease ESD4 [Amborella trichopoda]XP_020520467.1 ubiquitin-like-specific protease ESD4 [Amborella trichopoda]XP_020520469.1 ubiquitin-like-specific protease ESD4 [Amborella trichopoda]ERN02234.1 hypothetical protein AMTR_s00045p00222990 [Amborella trichopoda]|eukprot:XP_006840559.1 ubiquitin-like-specific protease ESD4 [Amborella trichopoda]
MHTCNVVMGVLTNNRKRPNDLFSLRSSPCGSKCSSGFVSNFADSEHNSAFCNKRARLSSLPPNSDPIPSQNLVQPKPIVNSSTYPSPAPLRRSVLGPVRPSKFSLAANQVTRSHNYMPNFFRSSEKPEVLGGGFVGKMERGLTRVVQNMYNGAKNDAFSFLRSSRKDQNINGHEDSYVDLNLESGILVNMANEDMPVEDYRRLVSAHVSRQWDLDDKPFKKIVTVDLPKHLPLHFESSNEPSSSGSGLIAASQKTDEDIKTDSLTRSHKDGKVRTSCAYKELHESAQKRNSNLSRLELEVKLNTRKFETLMFISQSQKEKVEDSLHKPLEPLSNEDEANVSRALQGGSRHEVLVVHKSSNIEITRSILQCLLPGAWLNDEVINLYLELLKEREKRDPKHFLKCHFFNTFFYKKLISGRSGYDYKAVRRWTTQRKIGYDLIECDKIFVPIHKEIHWCLAVINIKDKKLQYLDSLRGLDSEVLKVLARYIKDEAKDKSETEVDLSSWIQGCIEDLPEQQNGSDCGMFMIKYADFYSRGLKLSFSQDNMPYFRRRTVKEILNLRADA